METIKSYTDLEQSKVFAKILPLKSADMQYATWTILDNEFIVSPNQGSTIEDLQEDYGNQIIPCWSLAALILILPDEIKHDGIVNNLWITSKDVSYYSKEYDSYLYYEEGCAVDACYQMIIKLNELNLL